jgi:predicted metal-dependent enzyme (double-stranded beta helix superfamily)
MGTLSRAGDQQGITGVTMTLSAPLRDFVGTVERLVARELALPRLLDWLTPEFGRLLAEPCVLPPELCRVPDGPYLQHYLYGDPAERFSLVALVWRPGAATPIHDHLAWGLAGVYRGRELETRYGWCDRPGDSAGLRVAERREVCAGEVLPIVPPDDVHRVLGPGPAPTVSLHLYGCDVAAAAEGSSVRRVYPADLLIASQESTTPDS